ncbi:dipeptide epimerase [Sphingomonas sp. MAH-20]|uniref:Dipeptide epimerase n=1 Tax=Sphingomonas horti TaxID=2682842 RepID=A0A6I4IW94_9SPHN|nr:MULTISPECIES: dipeptide epimerase [Sphingomonas]MBA2920165.1 dipeptide epimerase [Sphingomonas sp. CGMCC 1.13658]MVO76420.1 dipeptide epimerase [Sphingomonas horti]
MPALSLDIRTETLRLAAPFRISGYVFETSDVVVVTLSDGEHRGRGEASGVYYTGDDVPAMVAALEAARPAIEAGPGRQELRGLLPPGGARNAVDCALWELEAARAGLPVWQLAGLQSPRPLRTTFTLGAGSPATMAEGARRYAEARSIKIKLTGELDLDIERVRAIRAARPDAWLGVDGNQGFAIGQLDALVAAMQALGVSLIEQPIARGREADLQGYRSPIPIAGDESILSLADVAGAVGRFDVINIKLDKCGGLTEGLMMAEEARRLGLGVMVGNMVGTSLAMAPAFVLGQLCDLVDLDGPTFLTRDCSPAVDYRDGDIWAGPEVWGGAPAKVA